MHGKNGIAWHGNNPQHPPTISAAGINSPALPLFPSCRIFTMNALVLLVAAALAPAAVLGDGCPTNNLGAGVCARLFDDDNCDGWAYDVEPGYKVRIEGINKIDAFKVLEDFASRKKREFISRGKN